MKPLYLVQCQNCGAEFTPLPTQEFHPEKVAYSCPICHYCNTTTELPSDRLTIHSQDELESHLNTFMHKVRMGGLSADTIVLVLCRELEFAAELAHPGRRIHVQLIDLGSQDFEIYDHSLPDQREILQQRIVGQ